jgi:hypothetical protein
MREADEHIAQARQSRSRQQQRPRTASQHAWPVDQAPVTRATSTKGGVDMPAHVQGDVLQHNEQTEWHGGLDSGMHHDRATAHGEQCAHHREEASLHCANMQAEQGATGQHCWALQTGKLTGRAQDTVQWRPKSAAKTLRTRGSCMATPPQQVDEDSLQRARAEYRRDVKRVLQRQLLNDEAGTW